MTLFSKRKLKKTDKKALENKAKKITISTIHSSKGLEWETVFLLNCIDGRFPNIMHWQIYEKEKMKIMKNYVASMLP